MIFKGKKWKNLAISVIVAFILIILFEILPLSEQVISNYMTLVHLKDQYELSINGDKTIIDLQGKNKYLEKRIALLVGENEQQRNLSSIVQQVNNNAQIVGVKVMSFKPGERKKNDDLWYQEIDIVLHGRFENIFNFVKRIEFLNQVYVFKEIIMSSNRKIPKLIEFKTKLLVYFDL